MKLIAFRSRLTDEAGGDYAELANAMFEAARRMPGFVDLRDYVAEDGERLALVRFEDDATLRAWRHHVEHRRAQQQGRERFYAWYELTVAEIERSSTFRRED